MTTPDILQALNPVVQAFGQLLIPYYIGGSVASSLYGMARSTMDIDIVADIKEYHVSQLVQLLKDEYYIDQDMIIESIKNASSFNLIHLGTAFKVDIFIYKDEPHQRNAIERKVKDTFDTDQTFKYYFSAPEDIIIAKLQWFEQGKRISERQWLDITGVIKVQADHLDITYLNVWAKKLGIFNLLKKAFREAGVTLHE
jgi:hypothetical protein